MLLQYVPDRSVVYCCDDYILILIGEYTVSLSLAISDKWIVVEQDFNTYQVKELFHDINSLIKKMMWLRDITHIVKQEFGGNNNE